jgi:hypothetical protein
MSENPTNISYNADFICTYKLMDNDDDRNIMYQIQILQAFSMHNFDENEMSKKILHLYHELKDCNEIKEILKEGVTANPQMKMTNVIMFMCLFSYDFFDLFHKCLIEYFTSGFILEKTKCNMIDKIKSD